MKIESCRGRIRTSTGQLAVAQCVVVNPSRSRQRRDRHYTMFILFSPPPRQEGMSAKVSSLHSIVVDSMSLTIQY